MSFLCICTKARSPHIMWRSFTLVHSSASATLNFIFYFLFFFTHFMFATQLERIHSIFEKFTRHTYASYLVNATYLYLVVLVPTPAYLCATPMKAHHPRNIWLRCAYCDCEYRWHRQAGRHAGRLWVIGNGKSFLSEPKERKKKVPRLIKPLCGSGLKSNAKRRGEERKTEPRTGKQEKKKIK